MNYLPILEKAAQELSRARRIVVITGAGMSADAGLPTYRGVGGLYENRLTAENLPIENIMSGAMLRYRPEITWKYLAEIEHAYRGKQPHAGYGILAAWEQRFPEMWVLTQNIDGFHKLAGSTRVIEMHGTLRHWHCTACDYQDPAPNFAQALPPVCPNCGSAVRPAVVLFGESLPNPALDTWQQVWAQGVDFVISIGTSSGFSYIAEPVVSAARAGIATIEINPCRTEVSHVVRYAIPDRALPALQALHRLLDPRFCAAPQPAF
jgi:NAD-dependent deacetylase